MIIGCVIEVVLLKDIHGNTTKNTKNIMQINNK